MLITSFFYICIIGLVLAGGFFRQAPVACVFAIGVIVILMSGMVNFMRHAGDNNDSK